MTYQHAHAQSAARLVEQLDELDARQRAELEAFAASHDDIVHAELIHRGVTRFRIIRLFNGDEAQGEGCTPRSAYAAAERNYERSQTVLCGLMRELIEGETT